MCCSSAVLGDERQWGRGHTNVAAAVHVNDALERTWTSLTLGTTPLNCKVVSFTKGVIDDYNRDEAARHVVRSTVSCRRP